LNPSYSSQISSSSFSFTISSSSILSFDSAERVLNLPFLQNFQPRRNHAHASIFNGLFYWLRNTLIPSSITYYLKRQYKPGVNHGRNHNILDGARIRLWPRMESFPTPAFLAEKNISAFTACRKHQQYPRPAQY